MLKLLCFQTPSMFLLICIFFFFTSPVTHSNNETDFQALVAFKNAILDDPQGALNSWNQTLHFCEWEGILCSRRHENRVVEIDLFSRGLVGTISPYLGNLSFLQYISLRNNTFTSQIPEEMGNLRRLKAVAFSNNSLSGEIPRNLSHCTDLYYLNLIDNDLTGVIPLELSSLMNLQYLGFGKNQLSGPIPPYIGNFTSLIILSLGECGLQGEIPESLVQLKSLQYLYIGSNNLTGTVPPGLYNISTMRRFAVHVNHLHGTLPSQLGFSSPSIRYISVADNHFTGAIPVSLSNFSSLKMIFLSGNSFIGRINLDFTRNVYLEKFEVDFNNLEGGLSFVSSMTNCTKLETLIISNNLFTGSIPHYIGNLSSQISFLYLDRNQLHGSIPSSIGNPAGLNALNLDNNYLDGPIPSDIGKLNELQVLMLAGNRLASSIPLSLSNLTSLYTLDLSRNSLSGNIPQSLANCTYLLTLDLSLNNLNGTVPAEILSLSSISILLNLSHNSFTGPIPSQVGSLMRLVSLDMSHNRLSGNIPNSLGRCVGLELLEYLEHLHLQNNSFSGNIPDELQSLRSVRYFDLSRNNLSGLIPSFLGGLDLLNLNLSFNRLEGEVPMAGVFLNNSAISLEGNMNLCGGIPSLSLRRCPSSKSVRKKTIPTAFKILIPVVSVGAILSACFCIVMYKRKTSKGAQSSMVSLDADYMRLSYADLHKSTGGFSESNLLGAGRFGSVYKGILSDMQTYLAVKVLNLNVKGASKSFMSECSALRGIRHRNLVKMVSVCSSIDFEGNEFKALVYEFLANGDLDRWLHHEPEDKSATRGLRQRLKIAIDVASALEYLHFGTGSTIIHGDLKPSNILLDGEMTARVGDFGLAKIISSAISTNGNSSAGIRGTLGYIPPEYGMSGMVSTEGDVYSFGILLLEMFTGRRPTDDEFSDSSSLRDFVRSALPGQVMEIVDSNILQEHYNDRMNVKIMKCVTSALEIGLACSNEVPGDRMLMSVVVNELHKLVNVAP